MGWKISWNNPLDDFDEGKIEIFDDEAAARRRCEELDQAGYTVAAFEYPPAYYTLKITNIEGADISRNWPIICTTYAEAKSEKQKYLKINPGATVKIISHNSDAPGDNALIL